MSLQIGIIGLPNVGKSTVFNALTGTQNAEVANYPFCTIQPNRAIVPLKDRRLERLQRVVRVPEIIYATIEFVDIAGLVKGASQGEGLGNQFLGNIRDTDAIVHVVRCFEDPNVVHVSGEIDPVEDIEVINIELAMADHQQLERKIERLTSAVKGDRKLLPVLNAAQSLLDHLGTGKPSRTFETEHPEIVEELNKEMRFLTAKPVIYLANVDEDSLTSGNTYSEQVDRFAAEHNTVSIRLCAELEEGLVSMEPDEQREYLELAGVQESGLQKVIREGFEILNLITFFTKNENEVRAWTIKQGTRAPQAAGEIHTDFERGFIRAEVIPFEVYKQHGSDASVRSAGMMRSEGKEYIVQDGDVILFRFNV